jgi:serine/threonine-protein kinase
VKVQHGQSLPSERDERLALDAIKQGIQHLEHDEYEQAVECFSKAIRLNPECARAYLIRGQTYSKMGKWAKAERDVSKARRVEARRQ